MKKLIYILPLLAILFSCKNKEEESEYKDWGARNQAYVDSIANLAKNGADGWQRHLSYTLTQGYADENPNDNNAYAYVQMLKSGSGTYRPKTNDTVYVHMIGKTIPQESYSTGRVFTQTYSGTIDLETNVPRKFRVNDNSNSNIGLSTAIMHMHVGDSCNIIVPYPIGYGTAGNSSLGVRESSTLIYTLKLMDVRRY